MNSMCRILLIRSCSLTRARARHKSQSQNNFSTITNKAFVAEADSVKLSNSKSKENDVEINSQLDLDLIRHLERTSLVDFGNEEALIRLSEAIRFADTIMSVDTTGIEPMISTLEDKPLRLREDRPEKVSRNAILCNAILTEEDYFVSPPGNIPLEPKTKIFSKGKSGTD